MKLASEQDPTSRLETADREVSNVSRSYNMYLFHPLDFVAAFCFYLSLHFALGSIGGVVLLHLLITFRVCFRLWHCRHLRRFC